MNLVNRVRELGDERKVIVSLTKNGIDLEVQVADIQNKVACKTHLNTKEFNELKSTLNKLADTMSRKENKLDSLIK